MWLVVTVLAMTVPNWQYESVKGKNLIFYNPLSETVCSYKQLITVS